MQPIDIMLLSGDQTAVVAIDNANAFARTNTEAEITAYYSLQNTGDGQHTNSTGTNSSFTWKNSGNVSDYQVRATVTSGTTPGGDGVGSWLSLGTSRSWSLNQYGDGTKQCTITVEIRLQSTGQVLDSATITIKATVVDFFVDG